MNKSNFIDPFILNLIHSKDTLVQWQLKIFFEIKRKMNFCYESWDSKIVIFKYLNFNGVSETQRTITQTDAAFFGKI